MKSTTPLTRHQVLLFKGDMDRLQSIYTTKSASSVLRQLLRGHLKQIEEKLKENQDVPV